MEKKRILMVCLGNICRSPLAEGILKSKVDPERVFVDSAGTGHWHVGQAPDPRSIEIGLKNKLDITDQRGRQFSPKDFEDFDLIYVMDGSNMENVLAMAKNEEQRKKVRLILDEIFPGENVDVPDPYFGGTVTFDSVYRMLEEACEVIAEKFN